MFGFGYGPTRERPAVCEDCQLNYPTKYGDPGDPDTRRAFTCDDCGGAVEVWPKDEIENYLRDAGKS